MVRPGGAVRRFRLVDGFPHRDRGRVAVAVDDLVDPVPVGDRGVLGSGSGVRGPVAAPVPGAVLPVPVVAVAGLVPERHDQELVVSPRGLDDAVEWTPFPRAGRGVGRHRALEAPRPYQSPAGQTPRRSASSAASSSIAPHPALIPQYVPSSYALRPTTRYGRRWSTSCLPARTRNRELGNVGGPAASRRPTEARDAGHEGCEHDRDHGEDNQRSSASGEQPHRMSLSPAHRRPLGAGTQENPNRREPDDWVTDGKSLGERAVARCGRSPRAAYRQRRWGSSSRSRRRLARAPTRGRPPSTGRTDSSCPSSRRRSSSTDASGSRSSAPSWSSSSPW